MILEEQNLNKFSELVLGFVNWFSKRIIWKGIHDSIPNGKEDTGSPGSDVAIHKTSPLDAANQILAKGKVLVTMYLVP